MARRKQPAPAPAAVAPGPQVPPVDPAGDPQPAAPAAGGEVYTPADFGYAEGDHVTDLHHLRLIGQPK